MNPKLCIIGRLFNGSIINEDYVFIENHSKEKTKYRLFFRSIRTTINPIIKTVSYGEDGMFIDTVRNYGKKLKILKSEIFRNSNK